MVVKMAGRTVDSLVQGSVGMKVDLWVRWMVASMVDPRAPMLAVKSADQMVTKRVEMMVHWWAYWTAVDLGP